MLRHRFTAISIGLFSMLPFVQDAAAVQSCTTVAGSWTDATGSWALQQSSNGNITGFMISDGTQGNVCPAGGMWGVSGSFNGNGNYSYVATWNSAFVRPAGCAVTISTTGSIAQPGCNRSTGTWSNSGGLNGTFEKTMSCNVPTGETTPTFVGWGVGSSFPTSATFNQSLTPTSFNYGGRYVRERFLNDGTDTCWFPNSLFTQNTTKPDGAPHYLGPSAPSGYGDKIGAAPEIINYYRNAGRTPCQFTLKQRMHIDCEPATGETFFRLNDLLMRFESLDIVSGRGTNLQRIKWGVPAPALYLGPILQLIFSESSPP